MKKSKKTDQDILEKISNEINSPLKRVFVENWIYAFAIILAILTVFVLGKLNYTDIQGAENQWIVKGAIYTGIVISLSFVWYIVFYYFARDVKEKKHARISLESISETIKWGDDWKKDAKVALEALQKTAAKENYIVISPDEYSNLLKATRDENENGVIQDIYLFGAMTGFLYLLPLSLRNHICITAEEITINIIGSSEKIGTEKYHNLKSYPIAFVTKTMVLLLECCAKFVTKNQNVTFNVYHFPYDIMEALYIIGDKKLVNLQSLDPNSIDIIFKNQQIGIQINNDEKHKEQFQRYKDVFTRTQTKLESEKEVWELSSHNNEIMLTITGKSYLKIEPTKIRYSNSLENINLEYKGQKAKDFLSDVYGNSAGIYQDLSSTSKLKSDNAKLHQIDVALRSYPNISKQPCTCGFTIK